MSIEHKAFNFDWKLFEAELLPILLPALEIQASSQLLSFIESNLYYIADPYEGEKLAEDWRDQFASLSVQEIADYALTKYYSVVDEFGLGDAWVQITDKLSQKEIDALLGLSFEGFDPGCYGSYFQSTDQLKLNIEILSKVNDPVVGLYVKNLCKVTKGLYVTF